MWKVLDSYTREQISSQPLFEFRSKLWKRKLEFQCVLNVTDKPIRVYREQSVTTFQPLPGSGKVGHAVKAATTEGTHTT